MRGSIPGKTVIMKRRVFEMLARETLSWLRRFVSFDFNFFQKKGKVNEKKTLAVLRFESVEFGLEFRDLF